MPAAKRSKAVDVLIRGALRAARYDPSDYLEGKRVLVVDNDVAGLEWLAETLRGMGGDDLEISTARTFNAALDVCQSHDGGFDLVVLSNRFGGGRTGIELLNQMRRAGLPETALAILHSKVVSRALRDQARAAGFCDTLATDDVNSGSLYAILVHHCEAPPSSTLD
jgi:CheY-like chemotaxis protein